LFDEREGDIIYNLVKPGVDLYIPTRYMVFDEKFLERPWDEYSPDWSYLESVLINIAGFIPLGFFSMAYLSSVRKVRRAALFTILLGCAVTLSIEILQAFLPTRNSGMTDLITNTLGTCLGIALYCIRPVRILYFAISNGISFAESQIRKTLSRRPTRRRAGRTGVGAAIACGGCLSLDSSMPQN